MKRKNVGDRLILGITLTLLALGVVMVYSASHIYAFERFHDSSYFLKKNLISIFISISMFFIVSRIPYQKWKEFASPLIFITIFLLLILHIFPSLSVRIGGATRWLRIGFFQFQPSELAKFAIILYLSTIFSNKKKFKINDYIKIGIIIGIILIFILKQPDFSTTFLLGILTLILIYFNGIDITYLGGLFMLVSILSIYHIKSVPYRWKRIKTFLDPWADPYGSGYHIIHSLIAIGSGGFFGVGLGNSQQKFNYLPEPFTDFIFSIICEELGFLGASLFLILYLLLFYRIIRLAVKTKDKFAYLMIIGIVSSLALQVIINVGVTAKMFPTTGLPLPFISYGGSSMLINLTMLGIIYNISLKTK